MSFFVAELGTLFFVQESDQSKNYEKNSSTPHDQVLVKLSQG
jgi:hypothetical protein